MKKTLLTLTLLCVALTLHALDYRQVIFGNAYENIIEINADGFFEQYPEVKEHYRADYYRPYSEWEEDKIHALPNYYRVYEQVIGSDTFFRVLMSFDKYTDNDFLDWKENVCFSQYVFYKESDIKLLQLGDILLFGKTHIGSGIRRIYDGLEIIERNNSVIGLMRHRLDNDGMGSKTLVKNEADYCLWEDVRKTKITKTDTIDYIHWAKKYGYETRTYDSIEVWVGSRDDSGIYTVLVDSRRPFMYTIQNAFDGNPATSYVENSNDDLFITSIIFETIDSNLTVSRFKLINGYAANNTLYEQNNQIDSIELYPSSEEKQSDYVYKLGTTLHEQEFSLIPPQDDWIVLSTIAITPGTKYNDTALAELDIYIDGIGWLFGGL